LSRRALRAAVEVAEHAGLLVHLEPAPVVARVATTTATVRRGDAWLARERAAARLAWYRARGLG
jgi:hypothetical protein